MPRGLFRPLSPRLATEEARSALSRRRGILWRRPLAGRLELVYMPLYLLGARVAGSREREGDRRELLIAVDATSGKVRRLDGRIELAGSSTPPPGEHLAPVLTEEEALERAASEFPWLVLPVALKHGRQLDLEGLVLRKRLGYPYWVQHFRRGRHHDFRALDGLSATAVGAAGRATLLQAFVAARRA